MSIQCGDLFDASNSSASLAHCVSRDLKMGKGIAKLFRQKFGRLEELEKANAKVGEIIVLKNGRQFIYYLVTKEKYDDRPTYEDLRKTLTKMRDHAEIHDVIGISMPKIACGLDRLSWDIVQQMIRNVFYVTNINIRVFYLNPNSSNHGKTKS